MNKNALLTVLAGCALGCTKNINSGGLDTGGSIACAGTVNGVTTTLIDATDEEAWVYLDFESCALVDIDSPENDSGWDLGLMRYNPKINGGVSGSGGMEVAIVEGVDFDEVTAAPLDGYITDTADDDDDGVPEYAMEGWYAYDMESHMLSPLDLVYVLKTVEGSHIKLQFDDYYDDAGTSGFVQFSWAVIDPPSTDSDTDGGGDADGGDADGGDADGGDADGGPNPDDEIGCAVGSELVTTSEDGETFLTVFNSESTTEWTCFSFAESSQVENAWDLAWKNWDTTTSARAAGAVIEGGDFDAIDSVPSIDWSEGDTDFMDEWYIYDPSTHYLTAKDNVYLIQDAEGQHWKIEITTYYEDGVIGGPLHRPTIRWAPLNDDGTAR